MTERHQHADGTETPDPAASLVVAIDGPAGSGKSTVSRAVAAALGFGYLDTGAMYRAVTWAALRADVALDDAEALEALAEDARIALGTDPQHGSVLVGETDVTAAIRSAEVTGAVSQVSAVPGVRRVLVARQRALAARGRMVVEGRDIGTVVLPEAPVKIFLTAQPEERARRRAAERLTNASPAAVAATRSELALRDRLDSSRAVSPLRRADDAVVLDTTELGLDEVVRAVLALCDAALGRGRPGSAVPRSSAPGSTASGSMSSGRRGAGHGRG